jgi:hypothetical protein
MAEAAALTALAALVAMGCGSTPSATAGDAGRCVVTPVPTACVQPAPAYAIDVAPVLDEACNTPACHAGGGTAWPLTQYADVAAWANPILVDVAGCTMPPPDAGVLPAAERQAIVDWVVCGAQNDVDAAQ